VSTYPFNEQEQDVIRALGAQGFRYVRETKKTIEFIDSNDRVLNLNREHKELAVVFGFGSPENLNGLRGLRVTGLRSSSNFSSLPIGMTRNGRDNHQGFQVVFDGPERIPAALEVLA
jgi:hypothetical protein